MPSKDSQPLTPTYQNLYPRHKDLDAAASHIQAQLPIVSANTLYGLLMTYHNTLLAQLPEHPRSAGPYHPSGERHE